MAQNAEMHTPVYRLISDSCTAEMLSKMERNASTYPVIPQQKSCVVLKLYARNASEVSDRNKLYFRPRGAVAVGQHRLWREIDTKKPYLQKSTRSLRYCMPERWPADPEGHVKGKKAGPQLRLLQFGLGP